MSNVRQYLSLAALIGGSLFVTVAAGSGTGYLETDLVVNKLDCINNVPTLTDTNGIVHIAAVFDPNLVNPWGVTTSATSPFWVADNNKGLATLYSVPGANNTPISINPLAVIVPTPGSPLKAKGAPTGAVFNVALAAHGFQISGVDKNGSSVTAPAIFLFATEDGTIVGWNPGVNPSGFDPTKAGTYGIIAVDNSTNPSAASGAVYKGLVIATDSTGNTLLYAANFRAGTVEVYDTSFHQVTPSPNAFTDPKLASGYAPFNIAVVGLKSGPTLFVTYARQNEAKHDDLAGHGRGFVDTFDLSGHMQARFAERKELNSPWGVVLAPATFGQFGGDLLIGNFGDGHINAFDPGTGDFLGELTNSNGQAIVIDGLWSLRVGNGGAGGNANAIYFTAGPNGEQDGLFGSLTPQ